MQVSGCLVVLQRICATKEESEILRLRSVFKFICMLYEAKEWIKRERRDRLGETEGLGITKSTTTTTTITTTVTMSGIITKTA